MLSQDMSDNIKKHSRRLLLCNSIAGQQRRAHHLCFVVRNRAAGIRFSPSKKRKEALKLVHQQVNTWGNTRCGCPWLRSISNPNSNKAKDDSLSLTEASCWANVQHFTGAQLLITLWYLRTLVSRFYFVCPRFENWKKTKGDRWLHEIAWKTFPKLKKKKSIKDITITCVFWRAVLFTAFRLPLTFHSTDVSSRRWRVYYYIYVPPLHSWLDYYSTPCTTSLSRHLNPMSK